MCEIIQFVKPKPKDPMEEFMKSLNDKQEFMFGEIMMAIERDFMNLEQQFKLAQLEIIRLKKELRNAKKN